MKLSKDSFPPRRLSSTAAYIPVRTFNFSSGGGPDLFPAVGILGATIMPHSLYLGSALATQDRASVKPVVLPSPSGIRDTGNREIDHGKNVGNFPARPLR